METNKAVAEYRECLACGDKSCLSIISNCPKKYNIQHYQLEAYCAIAGSTPLDRLEEICNAEREGRCAVLPVAIGDTVYWTSRFAKCVNEGKVTAVIISKFGFDLGISQNVGGNIQTRREFEKVFLTRAEAEAAIKGSTGIPQ
jgi:hypothetical protein